MAVVGFSKAGGAGGVTRLFKIWRWCLDFLKFVVVPECSNNGGEYTWIFS